MQARERGSAQLIVGGAVALIAAARGLYPVFYLFQAALDVGDPNVRPPTAYGLDNFLTLANYWEIMVTTLVGASAATVMALGCGCIAAGMLTRTNVPMRGALEQLMAVPYY